MNKLGKKRLLNVAKALRESPKPKEFSMNSYGHICGAPMCALGHYAYRRDLQRTFRLSPDGDFFNNVDEGFHSWAGLGLYQHFYISENEAILLFDHDGCGNAKTNTQAAKFIEKFVGAA